MTLLFNTKLESLMKNQSEMSEEENEHFLNELRKSELLVPLQIELDSLDLENMNLDGLNEINKEVKFHLKSLESIFFHFVSHIFSPPNRIFFGHFYS